MNSSFDLAFNGSTIPVSVTLTTNTGQFAFGLIVAIVGAFSFALILYLPLISQGIKVAVIRHHLKLLYKGTFRRAILINHNTQDFLNVQMISMKTMYALAKALTKLKGEPFDLILNTPGGEVYATQLISRLIQGYPGEVRAVIPMMAASGGTLLALSCDRLVMAPTAVLGPVDPQLGPFWAGGSAASWKEVIKEKGKESNDSTFQYSFIGKKVTDTLCGIIESLLLKHHMTDVRKALKLSKLLTDGSLEHIYQFDYHRLRGSGVRVDLLEPDSVLGYHHFLGRKCGSEVIVI